MTFKLCNDKGFSLIEVLISVVILSVGLLALAGFNGNLYKSVRHSSDRAKAMASAQILIDKARAEDFATLATGSDSGDCNSNIPHRTWTVTALTGFPNIKDMSIYVCWTDSTGIKQDISLSTQVAIVTVAAPTPAPIPTAPTSTATPAPCTAIAYSAGTSYAAGAIAKNLGHKYQCRPWPNSGWCSGAASAYAPGAGTNWQDAWTEIGVCT